MTLDLAVFFDHMRNGENRSKGLLGPTLDTGEVTGCEKIIKAFAGSPISFVAYALATAYHETAGTMLPIGERGSRSYFMRRYDTSGNKRLARILGNKEIGDGYLYRGRGYPQLTGRDNYIKASRLTGVDLVANPDRAMEPDLAIAIFKSGMIDGWYTTKRLGDYLPNGPADDRRFMAARRVVNGQDKALQIARYAQQFQRALQRAGYAG